MHREIHVEWLRVFSFTYFLCLLDKGNCFTFWLRTVNHPLSLCHCLWVTVSLACFSWFSQIKGLSTKIRCSSWPSSYLFSANKKPQQSHIQPCLLDPQGYNELKGQSHNRAASRCSKLRQTRHVNIYSGQFLRKQLRDDSKHTELFRVLHFSTKLNFFALVCRINAGPGAWTKELLLVTC